MTKRRSKKRTLTASIISLILCVSMLLGTTMAWFTDTVSNTGNRIVTGELGVQLLKYDGTDYADISDGQGDIFATQGEEGERLNGILWEPGKTEVVLLKVANTGNLALNYNIILDVTNETNAALEEVLSYAVIPNVAGKAVEEANVAVYSDLNIAGWQDIEAMNGIDRGVIPAGSTKAAPNGALLAGESDYFALAVHMDEDAGNIYQNQSIVIDVKVDAKQMPYEYDSFDNQYDANAEYTFDGITYHVSTTGNDSNPGTEEAPFATIAKANEVISALAHEGDDVQVLIHGGTYFMSEDIVFSGATAGGSNNHKVIYRAAGDGEVVFSGFIDIPVSTALSASGTTVGKLTSEKVQQELLKFDLSSYGVDYKQFEFSTNDDGEYMSKIAGGLFSVLLNGKEQIIASWPNYGEYEEIEEVVSAEASGSSTGAVFKYTYSNIDTWSEESLKESIVRGYLGAKYREEFNGIESVDAENREITLKWATDFPVKVGRDWRILNIAEEIDVPGEYCIDWQHSSLALYYYPPYELSSDDVLQLSVTKGASWICENTQNIVFDGIKFTGIRNSDKSQGVITINNSDNIEIRNCTFTYNDGGANITINGKNNIVEACGFYNCGAAGVFILGGGDYTTLERQNNVVINNHFYNSGYRNLTDTGGAVSDYFVSSNPSGVGNTINNNLIHHIYGRVSIWMKGIEYDVSYNEISNGLRNLADYGLIYSGRRPNQQGMTINNNYLHDFGSLKDLSTAINGIYIDDWNSGYTANNNIIVSNSNASTKGIFSVGAYNTFKYNILANSATGIYQGSRQDHLVGESSILTNFVNGIATITDALKAKYPFMLTLQEAAEEGKVFPVMNNVITDNMAYNAPYDIHADAITMGGTIENNLTVTGTNGVFVDPENHDWRITSEYATANNLNENIITEENFSMDQIGIQKDVWTISNPLDSFKQIYPKNGTNVHYDDVTLNWEQALFADEYEYVVAKDVALTDVVANGITAYEHVNIGDLVIGETYYWKITAVNTTRQLGASWNSEEVFSFTVGNEEPADKNQLVEAIEVATTVFATIEDGEANKVGDYMIGTKAKLQALLEDANEINENAYALQGDVDEMTSKLQSAVSGSSAYKYKGYMTLDTSDASKWASTSDTTTFAVEEGVMSVTGKRVVTYTDKIPNYNMVTFDVNTNLTNGYLGLMIRSTKPKAALVYNGLSYFFWITPDKIELQADPANGKETVIAALASNDYMRDDTWHNIRIETIDLEGGGVEIVLYIDNQEVLRHVDTTYMLYEEGTFALGSGGGSVMVRAASEIPTFTN